MESQEQDNVIGGGNYEHNLFFLNADVWTEENDWTMSIEPFKRCFQSLSAANAFHKQAAHEAVQEQYRLQKENEVLKEQILKLLDDIDKAYSH